MTTFTKIEVAQHGIRLGRVFIRAIAEALDADSGPEIIPEGSIGLGLIGAAVELSIQTAFVAGHPLTDTDADSLGRLFTTALKHSILVHSADNLTPQ